MNMIMNDKYRIFTKFLLYYMIILIVTLFIGIISYNEAYKIAKKDAIEDVFFTLESGRDLLEARLMEVDNMVAQLSLDQSMFDYWNMRGALAANNYFKMNTLSSELMSNILTNDFIDEFYLYLKSPDVLVSTKQVATRTKIFYNAFLNYEGVEFSEWVNKIFTYTQGKSFWPAHKVTQDNQIKTFISYIHLMPIGSISEFPSASIILIDELQIRRYFGSFNFENNGSLYVIDSSNNYISTINSNEPTFGQFKSKLDGAGYFEETTASGDKFVIIYTTSSYTGWTYAVSLPDSMFIEQISNLVKIFTRALIFIFSIGLLTALIFAYKNSRPIISLLSKLKRSIYLDDLKSTSDYDFIERTVSKLLDSNNEMESKLRKHVPLLRSAAIERLLRAEFSSLDEINSVLSMVGLNVWGESFIVALMRIDINYERQPRENLNKLYISRLLAGDMLKEQLGKMCIIHNIDNDKIAILLFEDKLQKKIEYYLKDEVEEFEKKHDVSLCFGVGNKCNSLMEVNKSFGEANMALEYRSWHRSIRISYFHNMPQKERVFYFPVETELKLCNLIKAGRKSEALELVKLIFIENFEKRCLSTEKVKKLVYLMRGNVLRVREEIFEEDNNEKLVEILSHFDCCFTIEELKNKLLKVYSDICDNINDRRNKLDFYLVNKINNYIDSNYTDLNLSLNNIAAKFDLTEKYLSFLFKNIRGENISYYIEKIRLQHSIRLLSDHNMPVKDVALESGYVNLNTFYKAFKRIYGVTPSSYRKNLNIFADGNKQH